MGMAKYLYLMGSTWPPLFHSVRLDLLSLSPPVLLLSKRSLLTVLRLMRAAKHAIGEVISLVFGYMHSCASWLFVIVAAYEAVEALAAVMAVRLATDKCCCTPADVLWV